MNKRAAMSGMGFAIVLVIIFGLIMIISAPSLVNNQTKEDAEDSPFGGGNVFQLQDFENKINSRLDFIESRINNNAANNNSVSNKYICTIEGNVDSNGNIVKVDSNNGLSKFVFVCEYRQ